MRRWRAASSSQYARACSASSKKHEKNRSRLQSDRNGREASRSRRTWVERALRVELRPAALGKVPSRRKQKSTRLEEPSHAAERVQARPRVGVPTRASTVDSSCRNVLSEVLD